MNSELLALLRSVPELIASSAFARGLVNLTLLTGLGLAAVAWPWRLSAAVRHRIAIATLLGALAIPAASFWMPSVRMPVLPPDWTAHPASVPALETATPAHPTLAHPTHATVDARVSESIESDRSTGLADTEAALAASPPAPASGWPLDANATLTFLLALPAVVLIARLARSLFAAHQLVRRSRASEHPSLQLELRNACERLGIRRSIELRESAELTVPVLYGMERARLLLPPSVLEWSAERRRAVLLHELAHVARRDTLSLLFTRLATALLWFHPLVWAMARHARMAAEQACDDVVLASGELASRYAEDLLAIARAADREGPADAVAPAFARRSTLERRLVAILTPAAPRGPATARATLSIGALAALLVGGLGSARVVAAPEPSTLPPRAAATSQPPFSGASSATELVASAFAPETSSDMARASSEPLASNEPLAGLSEARKTSNLDEKEDWRTGEKWFKSATGHYNEKRYAAAASEYLHAASSGYRIETAYYNAACSFALNDDADNALDALEHALDAGFDRPDLIGSDDDLDAIRRQRRFTVLLERARSTDHALARLRELISDYEVLHSRRSRNPDDWSHTGVQLMRAGEPTRAAAAFASQFAIDSSSTALYNQACAWALAGRRLFALDALERAVLAGFGNARSIADDDDLESLRGDRRFQRLVELTKELELSETSDSRSDGSKGWRQALQRYERVVREHPDLGRAWFNLGFARLRAGDPAGSAAAYERTIALGYRLPTSMYNLACAAAAQNRGDDAIAWLERAERSGFESSKFALSDPDLDALRTDARFRRLLDRWRLADRLEDEAHQAEKQKLHELEKHKGR
ncbi:MAG: tetratricopeptide repeat protein [Candidatus Eisenbacteria bacterium]|uniref:Tetratricopeptide repeat protein n=1 Tax=Eiseniibacteriota bacterium TaxID=2212470 RepID=A0A849SMU3_UNCEI|nr:tetratricopeptide repeat protein [Candidatus Eisenbacteria bacterium]